MEKSMMNRRSFLAGGALLGGMAAAGMVAGCAPTSNNASLAATSEGGSKGVPAAGDGKYSWEEVPEPIDESLIDEEVECEVCVVGCGNSGAVAALTAVEEGADVVVIQNKDVVHTQGTGNCSVGSKKQIENGIDYMECVNVGVVQHQRDSFFQGDPKLFQQWVQHSGEATDFIDDHLVGTGIHSEAGSRNSGWKEIDPRFVCMPLSNMYLDDETGADVGVVGAIKKIGEQAEQKGARFFFSTTGERLETDDSGRVVAALGKKKDGNYVRVKASKGVILCTGGYEANLEMRAKYLPQSREYAPASDNNGEGLLMASWVGGRIEDAPHCTNMHLELDLSPDANFAWGSAMPWLRVNNLGQRVGNEDVPYQFVALECSKQPDSHSYQILDSDHEKYYPNMVANGKLGLFRGNPDPAFGRICFEPALQESGVDTTNMSDLEVIYEGGAVKGCVYKGDTLDELAQAAGIDAEGLKATVERYNELYDSGADTDCFKDFNCMSAVRTPPFYCVPINPIPLGTLGGLRINENMQVLTDEGEAIPGLYAAGNASGNFFGGMVQAMTFGGLTIGRAHTFGRLAAQHCVADN